MRIDTVQNFRATHWGNAGPARIAPMPDTGPQPASSAGAAPAAAIARHAVQLPELRAFALPQVEARPVDIRDFLSMTATLLKQWDQVRLCQEEPAKQARVDLTA